MPLFFCSARAFHGRAIHHVRLCAVWLSRAVYSLDKELPDRVSVFSVFGRVGDHINCCRLVARYCFVEFSDGNAARQALETLNSQLIPGTSGVCIPYCILYTVSDSHVS